MSDPIAPARGCVFGLLIAGVLWVVILVAVAMIVARIG